MKKKRKIYPILIILLIGFMLIFALNQRTLYISDDFLYRFEFQPGFSSDADLTPVNGLLSLVKSQYYHYQLWNGRFVAHTIVQFFMQFDKWIFNTFNTLIFLFLGWLIVKISLYITGKNRNVMSLLLVYILLFLSIPNFGRVLNEEEQKRYSVITEVTKTEDPEVVYELHYGPFGADEFLQLYRAERFPLYPKNNR